MKMSGLKNTSLHTPSHIETNDEARALWKALFSDDGNPAVTKELQYIDDSLPTFKEMMENNVIDQKIAADVWEKNTCSRPIRPLTRCGNILDKMKNF